MDIEDFIEGVLAETFSRIDQTYNKCKDSATRLIFPKNREEIERVSEQELRFVFVEVLTEKIKEDSSQEYLYSVETPSNYLYRFSTPIEKCSGCKWELPCICNGYKGKHLDDYKGPEDVEPQCMYGDTANFDLVLHDRKNSSKRLAWIEFKANNCSQEDIAKDYLKLSIEATNGPSYFVQLLPSSSKLSNTLSNIAEKASCAINHVFKIHSRENNPKHIIHVLSHEPNTEGKNFQYNHKKASFEETIITHQK